MSLRNDQFNQILRKYDNRRFQNKHDLDRRRAEAYAAAPELKTLEEEMVGLMAQSGRLALNGDQKSLMELKAKSFELKARQTELLIQNGFSSDYLALRYHCSKCKDTGYIGNEKCSCLKQAIADLIYEGSNIKNVLEHENFNTFSFKYYSDDYVDETIGLSPLSNMQKIVASCKSFVRHFGKRQENILFQGYAGVGKTFLANCIAKELLDRGFTVIYLTAFRLFDILEKNKFARDEEAASVASGRFDYILDCDLLIIDDLGTELVNSFTNSQIYLIINERLLKQRSTIISTNLSLDNINTNYGERIYSRIIGNYTIRRIIGEDIRLHRALNNVLQ